MRSRVRRITRTQSAQAELTPAPLAAAYFGGTCGDAGVNVVRGNIENGQGTKLCFPEIHAMPATAIAAAIGKHVGVGEFAEGQLCRDGQSRRQRRFHLQYGKLTDEQFGVALREVKAVGEGKIMSEAPPHRFNRIEAEFGLPKDWCLGLIDEKDDWSFVIKLHALYEAVITRLLEAEVARPGLQEFVADLALGGQAGKLELARRLELIGSDSMRLIKLLGQFRNACVHDVRNVGFDFTAYLQQMPEQQRREALTLIRGIVLPAVPEHRRVKVDEVIASEFRVGLFLASFIILAVIHQGKEQAESVSKAIARTLEKHGPDFFVDDILDWDSQHVPAWRARLPKST